MGDDIVIQAYVSSLHKNREGWELERVAMPGEGMEARCPFPILCLCFSYLSVAEFCESL